jgi:hypothetical protein
MRHRPTVGITDGFLVVGLTLGVIGLLTVASGLHEPFEEAQPSVVWPITLVVSTRATATPIAAAVACRCEMTLVKGRRLTTPASRTGNLIERDELRGQGDVRDYLQGAAAVAHRYPWAGPWRGETQTAMVVNAPASIGSTSPP